MTTVPSRMPDQTSSAPSHGQQDGEASFFPRNPAIQDFANKRRGYAGPWRRRELRKQDEGGNDNKRNGRARTNNTRTTNNNGDSTIRSKVCRVLTFRAMLEDSVRHHL